MKGEIEEVVLICIEDNELTAGVLRQDDRCWKSQIMYNVQTKQLVK